MYPEIRPVSTDGVIMPYGTALSLVPPLASAVVCTAKYNAASAYPYGLAANAVSFSFFPCACPYDTLTHGQPAQPLLHLMNV